MLASPQFARMGSGVNIVCDGNSIMATDQNGLTMAAALSQMQPVTGSGTTTVSVAVSGNRIDQMRTAARPDAQWVEGKVNILLAYEGINTIDSGALLTGAAAAELMLAYCADRLAVHPWRIMLITALPGYFSIGGPGGAAVSDATSAALNAELDEYNRVLRRRFREVAHVLEDLRRPGSPWNPADYTAASFDALSDPATGTVGLFSQESFNGYTVRVHPLLPGKRLMARMVTAGLRRIPLR